LWLNLFLRLVVARPRRFDIFAPVQLAHEAAIGEAGKLLDGSARIMRTSEL
jgi:hypothetical protein